MCSGQTHRFSCDTWYFASMIAEIRKISITERLQFRNFLTVDRL